MNPFIPILQNRGFEEGVSGIWLSPDCKHGAGMTVELDGIRAIARHSVSNVKVSFFYSDDAAHVELFKNKVA